MIELPEAYVLAAQIEQTLVGKTISSTAVITKPITVKRRSMKSCTRNIRP